MYVLSKWLFDFLVVQDYSNLITQFAMQDYPVSSGNGMKEAFEKMLIDIPSGMATQTVHISRQLFYLNELLQQKLGEYLYTLGHEVEKSDVSPNQIHYLGFVSLIHILGWFHCGSQANVCSNIDICMHILVSQESTSGQSLSSWNHKLCPFTCMLLLPHFFSHCLFLLFSLLKEIPHEDATPVQRIPSRLYGIHSSFDDFHG